MRAADGRLVLGVGANDCDAFAVSVDFSAVAAALAPLDAPGALRHLTM